MQILVNRKKKIFFRIKVLDLWYIYIYIYKKRKNCRYIVVSSAQGTLGLLISVYTNVLSFWRDINSKKERGG